MYSFVISAIMHLFLCFRYIYSLILLSYIIPLHVYFLRFICTISFFPQIMPTLAKTCPQCACCGALQKVSLCEVWLHFANISKKSAARQTRACETEQENCERTAKDKQSKPLRLEREYVCKSEQETCECSTNDKQSKKACESEEETCERIQIS